MFKILKINFENGVSRHRVSILFLGKPFIDSDISFDIFFSHFRWNFCKSLKRESLSTLFPAMTKPLGMISTYASGVDVIVEWKIPGFWYLPKDNGAEFSSPDFSFGGHTWYLVIMPNGVRNASTYIDLRLWKHSSDHSIRQEFSLSLKTVKGEKEY